MNAKDTILLEEYKIINTGCQQYFDYIYRNMNITIVFFTTTFLFGLEKELEYFAKLVLFLYIIPVCGYVFGLLFFYSFSALAKLGHNAISIEKKMKRKGLSGYIRENKRYKKGYILSYGTAFMFYLVVPLISIYIGQGYIKVDNNSELFFHESVVLEVLILKALPLLCYVIYLIFSTIIFKEMWTLVKNAEKI